MTTTINLGDTIRISAAGNVPPKFNEKQTVTGSSVTLPATLSATTPVPVSTALIAIVEVLEDEVSANTYQTSNPSANVGYPV